LFSQTVFIVSALEMQTSHCYCGCSILFSFLSSSYSTYPTTIYTTWNFNTRCRMVSIHDQLLISSNL